MHPGGLRRGLRRQDGGRQQPGLARSGTPPGVEAGDAQGVAVGSLEVVGLMVRCPFVVTAGRNDGPLVFGRVRVGPLGQGTLHPGIVGGIRHLIGVRPGGDQVPAGRMQVSLPMSVLGHQGDDRPGADVPGGLGQSRSLPGTIVLGQTGVVQVSRESSTHEAHSMDAWSPRRGNAGGLFQGKFAW